MQLLLLKDVRKLGYVGDVVDVKPGYARNYLVPEGVAAEPTAENIAAIAEERKRAAEVRAQRNQEFLELVERMGEVGVTIEASANPEGTLYGSVGPREIAEALQAEGFGVAAEHVMLDKPIRELDTRMVKVEFTDEIATQVKVWVVREGAADDAELGDSEGTDAAGSADADGDSAADADAGETAAAEQPAAD